MSSPTEIRTPAWTRRVLSTSAVALTGALLAAGGAAADIIKKEDMVRGIKTTRAQCEAIPQTLWLNADRQDFCVRYYLSTVGGEGPRPVVFLQGDYFGKLAANNTWTDLGDTTDVNTEDLMRTADGFSKLAKTTAIYLARIGVDGTSGNHIYRKTQLELHLMNAALDAIKQRHGFQGFHLAGQSGGSKLVGGLIGMRRDIACAVSGSGPLSAPAKGSLPDPLRKYFDVAEEIPQIAPNRSLRLFVITDRADSRVPVDQQTPFVDKMRQSGHAIPQYFVEATDDHHHGVFEYTRLVASGCILGRSDKEIGTALGIVARRNVAFNEMRRKEISALATNGRVAGQIGGNAPAAPGARPL
jgi:hypothetical protein